MGFLGFGNYNKAGPGVSKDEPQKVAPVRFFEILLRKFWKLVQANLLFAVPMTIALIFLIMTVLLVNMGFVFSLSATVYVGLIPMIFVSPFLAGLTMITRNFTREEHAFIWTDFIKAVKSNFRLFLLNGLVCYLAFVILSIAIQYYYYQVTDNWFFYIPLALCLMLTILFTFAQLYMPTLLITFDLKYRQALKNAFLLGILGMGRNFLLTLGLLALLAGIVLLAYMGITFIIAIILLIFIFYAFCSFLISFATYPTIKKYMIDPQNAPEEKAALKEGTTSEQEASLSYWEELTEDEDDDSYVYVNGRMVKKSELKEGNE